MSQEPSGGILFDLLQEVMYRRIMDLYRGTENFRIIKPYVGIDGVMGFKGSILKKDPRDGSFRTVKLEIAVLDDLGYPLHNIEDLGGKCAWGEIVKKGHIFQCINCNRNFCEKHVRFLDRKKEYPVCEHDEMGCYRPYRKVVERVREVERQTILLEAETALANSLEKYFAALKQAEQAKEDYKDSKRGFFSWLFSAKQLPPSLACPNCNSNPAIKTLPARDAGKFLK